MGKASLDVAIEGWSAVMRIANSAAGIRKMVRLLAGLPVGVLDEVQGDLGLRILTEVVAVEDDGGAASCVVDDLVGVEPADQAAG